MKTNFEILEELYRDFIPEEEGIINQNDIVKIGNALGIAERSLLDCHNLKQFNTLFFEHKIVPIYIEMKSAGPNLRLKFEVRRDRYKMISNAVDSVIDLFINMKKH